MKDLGRTSLAAAMLACAAAAPAAADPFSDVRKPVIRPGMTPSDQRQADLAAARCARYGEGFVPIVGSDGCVRIGGRLRIDLGARTPLSAGPRDGFSPAAHLRLGR